MAKILKDLLLSLVNATLILGAICLFLFWRVTVASEAVIEDFSTVQTTVVPLREDLQDLTAEVRELRATLATAEWMEAEDRPAALSQLEGRLEVIDSRMELAQSRLTSLAAMPVELIDRAIRTGVDRTMDTLSDWRGCMPAQ